MDRQQIEKARDLLQEADTFFDELGVMATHELVMNCFKVRESLEILNGQLEG